MSQIDANRLLRLLPEPDRSRLLNRAEKVELPIREVVAEAGQAAPFAFFPLTSVFSAVVPLRDGSAIEAATVGNEGMVGIDLMTDRPVSVYRIVQQLAGESFRIPSADFRDAVAASDPLRRLLERYVLTVTHQSGQTAACNLRHNVEERMCRWLLMTHDRVGADRFFLTQDFLAIMLGVRRQTVSLVALTLQEAGLITYSRGNMRILNRAGLEAASCECYFAIRDAYQLVIGATER